EKLLGDRVDVRADVFSVGVMLWEALSGQRLLEAYVVDDIIARLMGGGIPRPRAPEGEAWTAPLVDIAERAIAVDPDRRFATVAEMKAAIEGSCARYLASAPGMAELFENPGRRARNHVRESRPPDSQRATQPPGSSYSRIDQDEATKIIPLDAMAADLTQLKAASPLHEDVTQVKTLSPLHEDVTRVRAASPLQEDITRVAPVPKAAPVPVVRKGAHVNTLLGVPPPYINHDRASAPDEPTQPRASIRPVAPVVLTPTPPVPSSRLAPADAHRDVPASQVTLTLGSAPPPSAPAESRRAASLSPLSAAPPPAAQTMIAAEPSFELVRPRKGRGAVWLVLGACAAIGLFAARPWLARQVAAATGAYPDSAVTNVDTAPNPPLPLPVPSAVPSAEATASASAAAATVGLASTPAEPSAAPSRGQSSGRDAHVVIHDTLEPNVSQPLAPAPAAPKPEPVSAPPAAPAPPPPTVAPTPAPKPKSGPVSDADRYGI
ncbi:MAG TPA: hypothetical protein VNG33_05565, partial [Polyangiaceae bacterium]|nr:hypothetical protein [Polyangiaceae bacterium]